MYKEKYHIHFVGIAGIGMSGIAELLLDLGYIVSGSDLKLSDITDKLEKKGAIVFQGHAKKQISGADVVVVSSAISNANPEVVHAKQLLIPVISRAEMLAELMRIKYSIAVSGSHGKTSTTSMIGQILNFAKLDPTIIIGGLIKTFDTNSLHGQGNFIVAEADESDGSFLKYSPAIAIVTNIDLEHLDFYNNIDEIKAKFLEFINSVPFYGTAILCLDNEHIQDILPNLKTNYITYGLTAQSDIQAKQITFSQDKTRFEVFKNNISLGFITLNILGKHNVCNALAAIAASIELNIDFAIIQKALEEIQGVKRRLEIKSEKEDILIMDDYGHHPTEIIATLSAIREAYKQRRLILAFQPHRYTRTQKLFQEFLKAFYQCDILIILPIYAASEKKIKDIDSKILCEGISKHGHKDVSYAPDFNQALSMITHKLKAKDIVLTMGAGDIYMLGEQLKDIL